MMDFIPTKRVEVYRLFHGQKVEKAKMDGLPGRADPRWKDIAKIHSDNERRAVVYVKTPYEVKIGFYFKKPPHIYEVNEIALIKDAVDFIDVGGNEIN